MVCFWTLHVSLGSQWRIPAALLRCGIAFRGERGALGARTVQRTPTILCKEHVQPE